MKKHFVVFQDSTGVVRRTGSCKEVDFARQKLAADDDIIETATHLHPDHHTVNLKTRKPVRKPAPDSAKETSR